MVTMVIMMVRYLTNWTLKPNRDCNISDQIRSDQTKLLVTLTKPVFGTLGQSAHYVHSADEVMAAEYGQWRVMSE